MEDEIIRCNAIRDGGSVVVFAELNGLKTRVRVMRSFAERADHKLFGKYEITSNDSTVIVEKLSDIDGLEKLIDSSLEKIPENLLKVLKNPTS